jgi:hypothetical protein
MFLLLIYYYFFFQFHTLEPCHPDTCAFFIGGDHLANLNGRVIEDWMKENKSIIKFKFNHVMKKKKRSMYKLINLFKIFNLLNGEF